MHANPDLLRVRSRRRLCAITVAVLALLSACTSAQHTGAGPVTPAPSATAGPSAPASAAAAPMTAAPASPVPTSAAATASGLVSPGTGTTATPTKPAASSPPPTRAASAQATNAAPSQPPPTFAATVSAVSAADLGGSWHPGCPVGAAQLRQIRLIYWGFDNAPHPGTIVVNAAVEPAIIKVFRTLYAEHFPIRRMEPTADFGGSDDASMAVDNTSGFNCRNAVAAGPPRWSVHAYGEAVDVNTIENPYAEGGKVYPPAGAPYLNRGDVRPGMAVVGGDLVRAFAAVGWQWGGRWTGSPDYQHFSANGG